MSTKSNRSSGTQHNQRGVTQGNTLVDPVSGLPVSVTTDVTGKKRLAVDASITIDDVTVETRPLTASTDAVRVEDPDSGAHIKVEPDGSINTNVTIDAKSGDNVAVGNTWKKIIDQPDALTTYIGYANPGTATASALWQIKRILVSGSETAIEFADGNLNFDNIWNNRTSLSYN
jgi:hypothetical protein